MNRNSVTTYRNLVEPTLLQRHVKVMKALEALGEGNLYDIADWLNTGVHNISGRLTELSGTKYYGKPLIEDIGMKDNKYGNACTLWRIKQYQPAGEQSKLF